VGDCHGGREEDEGGEGRRPKAHVRGGGDAQREGYSCSTRGVCFVPGREMGGGGGGQVIGEERGRGHLAE